MTGFGQERSFLGATLNGRLRIRKRSFEDHGTARTRNLRRIAAYATGRCWFGRNRLAKPTSKGTPDRQISSSSRT